MGAERDYRALPPDLPVPVDDGAADHLPGLEVPALTLDSTAGPIDLADAASPCLLVLYVYPRTGTPGQPLIPGWDDIPGARGCTPESCAFRDRRDDFADQGAAVMGMSSQTLAEQEAFAAREGIPYPVLSDPELSLAGALRLPTFEAGGMTLYRRLTLVAREGTIAKAFYPVFPPDVHAGQVLAWLRTRPAG